MSLKDLANAVSNLKQVQNVADKNQVLSSFKKFQLLLITNGSNLTKIPDLQIAMEGLEIGGKKAMDYCNIKLFEKVIIQLKQYYNIPELAKFSKLRQYLIGLYLMYLLTENRLSDFHIELELLLLSDLDSNFISFPISIEQNMMEGSYNKILFAANNCPDQNFKLFFNNLVKTVRNEIAKLLQSVHESLPIKDAINMLNLNDNNDLLKYIKESEFNWKINKNQSILEFEPTIKQTQQIESTKVAKDMLEFANNIETIV